MIDTMSGDAKTKNVNPKDAVKLELMRKRDRKKLRKMKSANFEIATQSKALWEECRRFVECCLLSLLFGLLCIMPLTRPVCLGLPGWAGTRKVKPIWILLKQETVSGIGISWAVCKSAPRSRQITIPAPHHSVFTGQVSFLPPNQQRQSTEGSYCRTLTGNPMQEVQPTGQCGHMKWLNQTGKHEKMP